MIKNNHGFSLPELMVVVAIIGILSHMGFVAYMDMMGRSGDAAAITDARNLMTVATEQFVTGSYPDFDHGPGEGSSVGLKPDGTYTYTLSTGVRAEMFGKPAAAGEGFMEGYFYHAKGTPGRVFYCVVDEKASVLISPHF